MIPMQGLLEPDQPLPQCNCGNVGDAESVASLTGIVKNLLPYWLTRYPDHPLAAMPIAQAAKSARGLAAERRCPRAKVFEQQAIALGRLFTIAAQFTDPHAYFVGGGVVETEPAFRSWFVDTVLANTTLRTEQRALTTIELIPHLDMAGARGAAVAALAVAARHRPTPSRGGCPGSVTPAGPARSDRGSAARTRHLLGPDDVHDRVDQRQVGERLREVAEVPPAVRVDLLGVELQRAGVREQPLAQLAGRSTSPISTSAETSQNEQIVNVPSSPVRPSSVSSTR